MTRYPVTVIVAGTVLLVAADLAAWVLWAFWHLLPFLLGGGW